MITPIGYENAFTVSLPQIIGIVPIQTTAIHVKVIIMYCTMDYTV